jgi:predicted RNA-binding protein
MHENDSEQEVMTDVARIEAEDTGVWLIGLLGEKRFVKGIVKTIDLVDQHMVLLEPLNTA